MDEIHLTVPALSSRFPRVFSIANRTGDIQTTLTRLGTEARAAGFTTVRVVVEPTGVYHKLLLRLTRAAGFEGCLVNAEDVVKMRQVIFGDSGKSDTRDPSAIAGVAANGRLMDDRELPEVFQLLRGWAKIYQDAEDGIIEAKNRIHRGMRLLFPDFDMSTDFLYDRSGRALLECYGLNPHRIAKQTPSSMLQRLRRHSAIRKRSVSRVLEQARASARSTPGGEINALAERELRLAWEDLERHEERRAEARRQLEDLYRRAREADSRLPEPVRGVISLTGLARFVAETGPLSDFNSWRQILRLAGMNLRERKSGKYVGQTKITHKGRAQLRRVVTLLALPIVRGRELFGSYYAQKTDVQKMPGKKAMTAVGRKLVKMIWGLYQSSAAFDRDRVFQCESAYRHVA
jgi:transposase